MLIVQLYKKIIFKQTNKSDLLDTKFLLRRAEYCTYKIQTKPYYKI